MNPHGTPTALPRTPRQLLGRFGLADEWPIPLERLARKFGFDCYTFSGQQVPGMQGVSGFVDHDSKRIFINRDEPLVRQRFTLAHEIGHVALHGGQAPVDYRQKMLSAVDPKETEANRFAADLLMDRNAFVRKWVETKGDLAAVAKHFGVSEDAAMVRVRGLKLNRA